MSTDLRFTVEIDGIQKTITSVADANKVIKDLTKNFVLLKQAGQDVGKTLTQISEATQVKNNLLMVSKGAVQTAQSLQGTQTASANASMALLNLNYVIRDSPYFFQNFALGVLAVGNNLNPLIDSFTRLKKEAGEKTISTFQLLKQALVGGAGISIAFSVVVTAIQAFVFWQAKSGRETENATSKIKEQKNELDKLTRQQFQNAMFTAEMQLGMEMPKGAKRLVGKGGKSVIMGANGEPITEGKAFEINERLNLLRQEYYMLGDIDNVENRLTINKQKLKDLNAQNFNILVSQATTLDGARQLLLAWIKDDEKQLKIWEGKTKELKIQKGIEAGILEARSKQVNFLGRALEQDNPYKQSRQPTYFRSDRPDALNMSSPSNRDSKSKAFGFGGAVKELGIELEMGKIAAQELGNAISMAFEQGNVSLNKFINSLIAAIAKMVILRAVTAFLTGGSSAVASPSMPSLPAVASCGLGKSSSPIQIQGKITANKNKFIVDIENARDYYNNNGKLMTVGRD